MNECGNDNHDIGCECGAREWSPVPPNLLDGTTEFMRLAGQLDESYFADDVNDPSRKLRWDMLFEEFKEYRDAESGSDPVETLDGLLDIIVIAWGTALKYYGEDVAKAGAAEVVRSNLSKVDGSLGPIVRRQDGKILKPARWTPPNIAGVLK